MTIRLLGLGLLSGGLLIAEIAFTRLFSALYYPPFVFAVISLALLGIGLGAGMASWRARLRTDLYTATYAALAALGVVAVFVVASGPPAIHGLLFPLVVLPFLCAGLYLATVFSRSPVLSPTLYLADLAGAGLGAALVVPLFNRAGVIDGVLIAGLAIAVAGVLTVYPRRAYLSWAAIALLAASLVAQQTTGWLSLDLANLPVSKPVVERVQNGGRVVHCIWNAFAHTDLIDPGNGLPYELYMDGAAGSVMPPAGGHDALWRDIGFFPFATEQPARVFLIGPGGGLDIWFGLQSNAQELVAVEVNSASVELGRAYAAYNGNLFDQPAVRIVVDEGRSVLQREDTSYDLIFLSQVVTLAAERDGYALVENSAYTVEAFLTYLEHLSPQGQIALKLYDEPTLTRALATALTALSLRDKAAATGVASNDITADANYLRHIIALLDPNAEPPIPLLLIRNTPYSREDALSIGAVANQVGFAPLYLPDVWAEPPLDAVQAGVRTFDEVIANAGADLRPTTDDRPFFFQLQRGLPGNLWPVIWSLAGIVLAGALGLGVRHREAPWTLSRPLYFAALGLGFILIEVTVIQQTRLFLGHPTYAVAVVLAALLVGGGLGSQVAGRFLPAGQQGRRFPIWPLLGILFYLPLWTAGWPWLAQNLFAVELPWRILLVISALTPLSLLLGIPFPLGLRAAVPSTQRVPDPANEQSGQAVALAWTINGIMSVAGAVLAVVIAILAGYTYVLGAGWLSYAAALVAAIMANRPAQ